MPLQSLYKKKGNRHQLLLCLLLCQAKTVKNVCDAAAKLTKQASAAAEPSWMLMKSSQHHNNRHQLLLHPGITVRTVYRQMSSVTGLALHGSGLGCGLGLMAVLLSRPSQFVIFVRHSGPEPVYSVAPLVP